MSKGFFYQIFAHFVPVALSFNLKKADVVPSCSHHRKFDAIQLKQLLQVSPVYLSFILF